MSSVNARATVLQFAHPYASTYDHHIREMPLLKKTTTVGTHAWVRAYTFVDSSMTISDGAAVGAWAVALKDIPPGPISADNPARPV